MTKFDLSTLFGKYTGFSPTDESSVGMGEMEITIGPENIAFRMASGLKIIEETVSISEFEIVAPQEVLERLTKASPSDSLSVNNIVVELRHESGAPVLTFVRELEGGGIAAVMMTGTLADYLGPTFLFSQAQIEKGIFDQFLANLELNFGKDQFPRLAYNGKAKPDAA